jgi:DNA-binding MltR family transcriptional regulator
LRLAIVNRLIRNLSRDDHDALFLATGPLASLRAKTLMAFAMGIIDSQTRHDLDTIREVRNALAHTSLKISFDTPEVAALCNGLHALAFVDKANEKTPRAKYSAATRLLMIRLIAPFNPENLPEELKKRR